MTTTRMRRPLACFAVALSLAIAACGQEAASEHIKRGDASLRDGRYAAALAAYSHARELSPNDPAVQRAMMQARVHLIAEDAARISPDALEDARYEAELLLEIDKPRAHVYLTALGNVALRRGDVEGAKLKYGDALKGDPGSPLAHTALALALMGSKDGAAQAKAELEAALKTKPDHLKALVTLGQIKLAEGDPAGAVDKLEVALRAGDDVAVRAALGRARLQQNKPAEAVEHLQRAAQLDPKNADVLATLGQALLAAGRVEEAERALRATLQLRTDPGSEIALGLALARQKKLEAALHMFGQALSHEPYAPQALYGAGTIAEELGRRDQASDYYRRLLAINASGADRAAIGELQRDAQARLNAIIAAATPTSSAAAGPPSQAPGLRKQLDWPR